MTTLDSLNIAAPIAATYTEVEEMLLVHIAEQLAANPDDMINATSEWRIRMLAQLGRVTKKTARIIAEKVGKEPKAVEKTIQETIDKVLLEEGLEPTPELQKSLGQALTVFDKQSGADYAGVMKSKYNQVNTVMQYKAKELYVNGVNMAADRMERKMQAVLPNAQAQLDILNKNALAVTLGEKSRTEALRETVKEMQKKGIPAFIDASGREWSPEAYVNMDIRNTVKNAALEAQFMRMDEDGQDIFLVSSHSESREKCAPYQGRFYSRSGKSGTIRDVRGKEYKYEPFSVTSYGEPDGLFGINCGHKPRGVSDGLFVNREKTQEEYEAEYPQEYKDVAAQRQQERKVRYDETQAKMLEAVGDTEGAKQARQKAVIEQKKLDVFCEEKGLNSDGKSGSYGYVKKDVDKSVKSDIMEMGSDDVALELQRYGRNKDTLVNKTYIDSGEYKRKFDNATSNVDANKTLYDCAKQALKHRSGTVYEDMFWIDGDTGKIVISEITSTTERAILYSERIRKAIQSRTNLIALHTHPSSMPPSISDFNSCYQNKYVMGFVACHNGTVIGYTSNQLVDERLYNMYVQRYVKSGLEEFSAQIKALEKLSENYDIHVWEVN